MTPMQKIKHMILIDAVEYDGEQSAIDKMRALTGDEIDSLYEEEENDLCDVVSEFREGQVETGIECEWSRNHESKSVAAEYLDGSWIGWTYWYGGGKHAQPETINWMEDAYDIDCAEDEKMVVVRTFTKLGEIK